jgi:hypothetical protein
MSGLGTFWLVLLATFAIVGIAVLGMALGVMTTGRCLRGSCGGSEVRLADGRSLSCADCPNRKRRAAG